jgi:hypothetical protein
MLKEYYVNAIGALLTASNLKQLLLTIHPPVPNTVGVPHAQVSWIS